MDTGERDALLMLTLVRGLAPLPTRRALEALGSARAVLEANVNQLAQAAQIQRHQAEKIRTQIDTLADGRALAQEHELIQQFGVTLLALSDPGYPKLLKHINDPPPLLFVRGRIDDGDALALGVVGARKCSAYGREQADRLAALGAGAGLCIVSGGAYGIDAAAHHAVLRVRGRTIAVLGSGLANPYPTDHVELFDRIAADGGERGAVVSELPMNTPPMRENFPSRNRIISGMSLGVLVVEASLRSGALITARLAADDHGREVMALPGRVDCETSAGCHRIIREGWATLVTNAADVLDALGDAGAMLKAGVTARTGDGTSENAPLPSLFEQSLSESQRKIMSAVDEGVGELDRLSAATQLPVATLQADLTMLQIRGLVARQGGRIVRKR